MSLDLNIFNESQSDLRIQLVGKKIKFKKLKSETEVNHIYINKPMQEFSESIATIYNVYLETYADESFNRIIIKIKEDYGNYNYEIRMIDEILSDKPFKIKKEETQNINIEKGDLVKFKFYREEQQNDFFGIPIVEIEGNNNYKDKEFIVTDIINNKIMPYFLDDTYIEDVINLSSVEIVKKNYLQTITEKKNKTKKEKEILDDLKLIEEMKNKVNIKDFKKIYAGAISKNPKDLKGIELLLNQWAFNKRHIYKMLGNNLSICKTIEYEKDESLIQQDRETLYREFPGAYYVIKSLTNNELLNNKLNRTLDNEWTNYGRKYKSGERISKLLDEAFKSDKLNTEYSKIIAQNKIKGNIEISIDPIEILLMSCNVSGWSSCHTINKIGQSKSYGCYSAGIFSYMCDTTSLIAFRHDGKLYDFKIGKQKVQEHSKNWRQMIWLKEDMNCFITSREYPNNVEELTKTVREMLEEQINSSIGEFTWVHTDKTEKIKSAIFDNDKNEYSPLHYNDMLHSYKGDMCYHKDYEIKEKMIGVGSHPVCPSCGEKILTSSSHPSCNECIR